MREVTATQLRELLHYDPETGVFTIRVSRGSRAAGEVVGTRNGEGGHLHFRINKRKHYLHRLAFLYMTGALPVHVVDHINGDATDNRWANLRDVPQRVNTQNMRRAGRRTSTGVLGVSVDRSRDKFATSIRLPDGSRKRGRFDTVAEAQDFYLQHKRAEHEGCTI